MTQSGFKPNIFLLNTLVNIYAKCGSIVHAHQVFQNMTERNLFTWTIMITGYAKNGCGREALEIYEQMIQEGMMSDKVTFISILNACATLGALDKGKEIHVDISRSGIAPDITLENTLVDMYAKCSSLKDARQVFDNMVKRSVVSWNAMIAGYAQHGCCREAFKLFEHMIQDGVTPDKVTFIWLLNACSSLGALEKGKEVHAAIRKAGIAPDIILETALTDMYAKCGSIKDAREVFDTMGKRNVVSWNTMIGGYAEHGCGGEALDIYGQMLQEGVLPDKITFICVLRACTSLGALEKGKEVHANIIKAGIGQDIILETALADMYAMHVKCFDSMAHQDVVSWTTMIAGYDSQHGYGREAIEIYEQMIQEGVTPDKVTFICILNACGSLGALDKGKKVHADMIKAGVAPDLILETALADMYAQMWEHKGARKVFDNIAHQDVVSWNAMIAGCAQNGHAREALQVFEQRQLDGVKPNSNTFISLLSACSHAGLVDEGRHYFNSMTRDHGLTPTVEHFGCIVDLLGRSGQLDEAEDFINKMLIKSDTEVWRALLGACRIHGNVEIAERATKIFSRVICSIMQLNFKRFTAAGRWDDMGGK